jgi:hypothetical protein
MVALRDIPAQVQFVDVMVDFTCRHSGPYLGQLAMAELSSVTGDTFGDRAVRDKARHYAKLLALCTRPTVLITIHVSPFGRIHRLGAMYLDMLIMRAAATDHAADVRLGRALSSLSDDVAIARKRAAFMRRLSTTIQSSCAQNMFASASWSYALSPYGSARSPYRHPALRLQGSVRAPPSLAVASA